MDPQAVRKAEDADPQQSETDPGRGVGEVIGCLLHRGSGQVLAGHEEPEQQIRHHAHAAGEGGEREPSPERARAHAEEVAEPARHPRDQSAVGSADQPRAYGSFIHADSLAAAHHSAIGDRP